MESVDPAISIPDKHMAVTDVSVCDDGTGTDPILTVKFTGLQLGTLAVFERSQRCCLQEVPRVEGIVSRCIQAHWPMVGWLVVHS